MILGIDLETLDTKTTAVIAAIGLALMTEEGVLLRSLKLKIDLDQPGRTMSSSTMAFWLNQPKSAQELTFATDDSEINELYTLCGALTQMSTFIKNALKDYPDAVVWGNPATFDITILEVALESQRMAKPWSWWAVGDCRTLKRVSSDAWRNIPFEGIQHDCLYDAVHLCKIVCTMLKEHK